MSLKKRLLFGSVFFVISLTLIFINFKPSVFQSSLLTYTALCTIFIIKFIKKE
ncbi:hypothetical protein JOC86_001909 [Bacillus pakistanensis]|uniref:ATP synthase F0 subunit 8 n=1 Tax=Rossellomorea pakistanensis TaxID=992288 RepID=A0ABS2NBY0_9BACI|nr:hypothetical protein [Bacillus pakistanensis]